MIFSYSQFFTCTGGTLKCGVWIQNTNNLVNQKFSKLNDSTYCYCTGFRVLVIGSYFPHWCKHKFMNWCCHKLRSRCWICKTLNHLQVCSHIELESCEISVIISSWITDVAGGHRIRVRLSYILHKQKFKTQHLKRNIHFDVILEWHIRIHRVDEEKTWGQVWNVD